MCYNHTWNETPPQCGSDEAHAHMQKRALLGEILVRLRAISSSDIPRILDAQRRRSGRAKFGETARAMGLISAEHIIAALAVQMDLLPDIGRMTLPEILQAL
jgi:hypothetical protein